MPVLSNVPLVGFTFFRGLSRPVPASELARLARLVASQVPSLKYVGFNLATNGKTQAQWSDCEYAWYSVKIRAGAGDSVAVVTALSAEEGIAVHRGLLATERG